MKIYHIGVISFDTEDTKRESKAVGGIQGYILELVNYLLINNISVGLIGKIYNFKEKEGLSYFEIQKQLTSTNKFLFKLFYKSFFIKLPSKSIIHAHRPDHLAAFSFFKDSPTIISLHGQQSKTVNDRKGIIVRVIYKFLERIALKKSKAIIAVDEFTKKYYLNKYPKYGKKLVVIPTGVNTNEFKPLDKNNARKKMGFKASDKIIVYVGRIEPPKRIDDIIRAFQILANKDHSYKLVFVGDGLKLEEMKNLVIKLNLNNHVSFVGIRKRNELPEIFNMSDVSVLYSNNEGSPLSIKESLACGIPVVANCVGDIEQVVKSGYNGYIVKEENIKELAKQMKLAVENAPQLHENCVNSIKEFTTEKVNRQMLNLYKIILDKGV